MPTRPEVMRPDGIGLRLDSLSLDESNHSWTDDLPVCPLSGVGFSTNQIYKEGSHRIEEHQFEDRSFRFKLDSETYFYGLFDGHDGSRVADFAAQRMPAEVLLDQLQGKITDEEIREVLNQAFHAVEKGFFESIDDLLAEKANLQLQLQGLSSYEAVQKYPEVVNRLRTVRSEISGGTTAVVTLVYKDKLYVANVGDSRALLCKCDDDGVMRVFPLSIDHVINNDDELLRLSQLGLDTASIRRGSKIGNQDNTRCIGNYQVKGEYKDFETLSVATEEPVIAQPEICGGIVLDKSCKFLMLISDGLYRSLEQATMTTQANIDLAHLVLEQFSQQSTLTGVAQAVVDRVVRIHHDTFMRGSSLCHKRDDITLLIRNFNQPLPNSMQSPTHGGLLAQRLNAAMTIWSPERNELQNVPELSTTSTKSSSDKKKERILFQNPSQSLSLDEEKRTKAYVDFSDYYKAVEQAREAGELLEGIDF